MSHIDRTLDGLCTKPYRVRYDKKCYDGKKKLTDRIEYQAPLFKIHIKYYEGLTEQELQKLNEGDSGIRLQKGEVILIFNPVLIDQIDSKFTLMPTDINQRIAAAAGGALKVTNSMNSLRDYLLRELSNKRYTCEIYEDKLMGILGLSGRRKERNRQQLSGAIDVNVKIGLISEYEETVGLQGKKKYIFHLNKAF